MADISAQELKTTDPKRYDQEYWKWVEHALDYDWWDSSYESFKSDMEKFGVSVEKIYFSVSCSQSDYASFEGTVDVGEWMEQNKEGDQTYAEAYPALYLAVKDYGGCSTVSTGYRDSWPSLNWDGACVGNTFPSGIFQHLEQEAWDELVEEQYRSADLEKMMQEWINDKCRELYNSLCEESEYLTSEEQFIESCECNEVTFEIEDEEEDEEETCDTL